MEHVHDPDHGKLRKAASDGFQAAVWVGFFALLALLLVLGIGWGLSQRWSLHAPDSLPVLPTLPGKTPEPQPQAPR
ncbi:MAG TPA: hypothetical protein VHB79_29155 [Polyangiaceae bacterium]|nr:hypothetical protein [Polyangiaceae bacterium]